jgi:hypothetical protein
VIDTVTILRARSRRLAKTVNADGSITDFAHPHTFDLFEVHIDGLDALAALLSKLERRADCCVVRGAPADAARTRRVRRLLHPHDGEDPTLRDVSRRWLALDCDSLRRPEWVEIDDLLACACTVIERLPSHFHRAAFIVQATAGHGLKRGIRLRLWCWLSRPTAGSELKYWLRHAPVDRSVFGAAQLIYTAAPLIAPVAFDPLSSRFALMPGNDAVTVPTCLEPPKPKPREYDRTQCRNDIEPLIRFVESAQDGERNNALYWAARRAADAHHTDQHSTDLLKAAAVRAGLDEDAAAATISSGFRHG